MPRTAIATSCLAFALVHGAHAGARTHGSPVIAVAHAAGFQQATPEQIAALDAARAEAHREFATAQAATAAYQRLVRLRENAVALGDPRSAIWLADAAEDALVIGLRSATWGLDALVGLRTSEATERTGALLTEALSLAQRADEAARAELARGIGTPELMSRLDGVERARRIPLLRAAAAAMAARVGALPADDRAAVLEASIRRLETLLPTLEGQARALATLSLGVALAESGRAADAQRTLLPIASDVAASPGARVVAMVTAAECSATTPDAQRRALWGMIERLDGELDESCRLALGDADFRLAMAAGAAPDKAEPWRGWMRALSQAPLARRADLRLVVLERLADAMPQGDLPLPALAHALRHGREPSSRAQVAASLAKALESGALPAAMVPLAEFELGRMELLLGQARDGATRLLRFAQQHPADPASRHAIDAAVLASRALGDPALLAAVLDTATRKFPDHPDHGSWRIEAEALALSPDASLLAEREPAARRLARALDALSRAELVRNPDPALLADLAIAAAEAANDLGQPDEALRVLDRVVAPIAAASASPDAAPVAPSSAPLSLPASQRTRMLEERIAALATALRSVDGDAWVQAEQRADAEAAADACARVLRRMMPLGLASGLVEPPSAGARVRGAILAQAALRMAPPSPDRDDIAVCALLLGDRQDAALPIARRVHAARGDRADALLALAEALFATGDQASLGEAMPIYTRLSQGCTEGSAPWWVAELRRLQVLDRVNRNTEVITPRVARLEAAHADLGGAALRAEFLALAARHRDRAATAPAASP